MTSKRSQIQKVTCPMIPFKDKQHESTVIKARKGLNASPRERAEWEKTRSALQRCGDVSLLRGGYVMT